jgi:hypothetical protein
MKGRLQGTVVLTHGPQNVYFLFGCIVRHCNEAPATTYDEKGIAQHARNKYTLWKELQQQKHASKMNERKSTPAKTFSKKRWLTCFCKCCIDILS